MTKIKFRYLKSMKGNLSFEMIDEEVDVDDIQEFGVFNYMIYNRKGYFKSFHKRCFLQKKNGIKFHKIPYHYFKELKKAVDKKLFTVSKFPCFAYKNYSEKKAVDWVYKLKENK